MLVNYKNEIMHDSTKRRYREPFGAVTAGMSVTLRLRTRIEQITSVYLCLFNETYRTDIKMSRQNDCWSITLDAPDNPDVYWYYFVVSVNEQHIYYGAAGKHTCGIGCAYTEPPPAYQLTVYRDDFDVPEWFQKSVMYQIFPDRFARSDDDTAKKGLQYHRDKGRTVYYHQRWNEQPLYKPMQGSVHYCPCDYFGGTLKGIENALNDIKSLGISVIYLNPVFEAPSNHRYNTADYHRIDPVLGTNEDFASLCRKAAALGIRIMLDGVFSHTGSDSIYFNKDGRYEGMGAADSKESPYYPWYSFTSYPDKYKCWWGFESLPEVDESNATWQEFVITGENSVIRHWIREGACGYRLDVADELPDDVLEMMRSTAKQGDKEAVLLGEVWEDATTKHSLGGKRRYALGAMLDSVTNYPLRNAIVGFLNGGQSAGELRQLLQEQASNYPLPMYYALMNLLSSHDIERIRTALSTHINPHDLTREQQATFYISDNQNKKGARLQRLAAVLQMALPGVPCVYYGDEKGMNGFLDPFNRGTLKKCAYDLTDHYQKLIALRNDSAAMSTGCALFFAPDDDCIGILRYITQGKDALGRDSKNGICMIAINRSKRKKRIVFDLYDTDTDIAAALQSSNNKNLVCALSGKSYALTNGLLDVTIDAYEALWLKII